MNSILHRLQIFYIFFLVFNILILHSLLQYDTQLCMPGSINLVRHWQYYILIIWQHGEIMVENHAN